MSGIGAALRPPVYRHLIRMTTDVGLFEHALLDEPRVEHGYCVDDVARALTVTVREPRRTAELDRLTEIYLGFLEDAVDVDGRVHNRMDATGRWIDEPTVGDWWGRAVGALGVVAAHAPRAFDRTRATYAFLRAAGQRSPDVRASAFAALGAAQMLGAYPDSVDARRLLADCLAIIPLAPTAGWDWPEARLRYANATLCEALLAGGAALDRRDVVARGLGLLGFLLGVETGMSGRLSPTGSAGRGPAEHSSQWGQQAIEVAAIADACAVAFELTADPRWRSGVRLAWGWFDGENDAGVAMYDPLTGAGYDGIDATGRNGNRGAESTLAALSTLQRALELGIA